MSGEVSDQDLVQLSALVDGELDPAAAAALTKRIAAEPNLRSAHDAIAAVQEAVERLPRPEVPADLQQRIGALASHGEAAVPRRARWPATVSWRSLAASVLVSALAAGSLTYSLVGERGTPVDQLIAAAHRRGLLAASPVDVVSSDRHTVKPWLDARLGISPPAPDLATGGFTLLGGRVEVIADRVIPALVYRHNEHTITLVARPNGEGDRPPRAFASGGYNMVEWSATGFTFTAVSDLEAAELAGFVADYRAASESAPAVR